MITANAGGMGELVQDRTNGLTYDHRNWKDLGRAMNEATKDNVGNSMAVIFKELKVRLRTEMKDGEPFQIPYTVEENRVINVATIQSALGFRFRITGLGLGEARDHQRAAGSRECHAPASIPTSSASNARES